MSEARPGLRGFGGKQLSQGRSGNRQRSWLHRRCYCLSGDATPAMPEKEPSARENGQGVKVGLGGESEHLHTPHYRPGSVLIMVHMDHLI